MRLTGVVVNRMHLDPGDPSDPELMEIALAGPLGGRLAGRVAGNLRDFQVLAERDRVGAERLSRELGDPPVAYVPGLGGEADGIAGLARVGSCLFGAARGGRR